MIESKESLEALGREWLIGRATELRQAAARADSAFSGYLRPMSQTVADSYRRAASVLEQDADRLGELLQELDKLEKAL